MLLVQNTCHVFLLCGSTVQLHSGQLLYPTVRTCVICHSCALGSWHSCTYTVVVIATLSGCASHKRLFRLLMLLVHYCMSWHLSYIHHSALWTVSVHCLMCGLSWASTGSWCIPTSYTSHCLCWGHLPHMSSSTSHLVRSVWWLFVDWAKSAHVNQCVKFVE